MSIPAALAHLLASNGFGTLASTIWAGGLTDSPDKQLAIATYNGTTTETFEATVARPSVQVMVRGNPQKYLEAEAWAMSIWSFLANVRRTTISGVVVEGVTLPPIYIEAIDARGTITPLGADASERHLFSINLGVTQ